MTSLRNAARMTASSAPKSSPQRSNSTSIPNRPRRSILPSRAVSRRPGKVLAMLILLAAIGCGGVLFARPDYRDKTVSWVSNTFASIQNSISPAKPAAQANAVGKFHGAETGRTGTDPRGVGPGCPTCATPAPVDQAPSHTAEATPAPTEVVQAPPPAPEVVPTPPTPAPKAPVVDEKPAPVVPRGTTPTGQAKVGPRVTRSRRLGRSTGSRSTAVDRRIHRPATAGLSVGDQVLRKAQATRSID